MAPPLVHLKASFGAFVVACCFLYSAQVDRLPPSPAAHVNFAVTAAGPRDVVADLLVNLTTAQKVGQLLQVDIRKLFDGGDDWNNGGSPKLNKARVAEYAKLGIGSFFNTPFDGRTQVQAPTAANWRSILHDIHTIYAEHHAVPFVYGIDTIHGANYIQDATLFPQPLAAASSFNVDLVYRMGQVAAKDTLAAGIPWVFSPVLGIAAQPKWSRNYETFGEDPHTVSAFGVALIQGLQANNRTAACMKHFIGYSNPTSGNDRADSVISDFELVNYYAPSFLAAVHQGRVKSAMETYTNNSTLIPHGVSVRDALNHTFANVRYAEGVDTTGHVIGNRTADLALAASSTYTIVVVGESPYAEKNGDIDELALPDGQLEYVRALTAIHSTNVILVVVQGRPRLLQGAHKLAAAVLVSFLPCEQGGQAIADVISGRVNPSAKLPLTYPQASGNIHLPYFHRVNSECREGFQDCAMEWTFGAGLSYTYTSFEYSNVTLSDTKVWSNGTLTLDVTVTNTGLRAGKEVVFVFISQKVRHGAVPEVKLLKHFTKVSLQPQEATTVRFTLSAADWSYYRPQIGRGFHSVSEPGLFHAIVKHDTDCGRHPALCKAFHVEA
ncbi:hypothetical protein H257_09115 [Aphanomyces astaci]|uniref:beta-glucosidase n=1 Tax=Aphanomyces astaci TaxID=112090 RepID=W4GAC0_APHAT|nr:hypothetical protein H257_09115 [Aphanomyces astaci]ETV76622.1 hypothetical protein H257_09115 [Aphanomyces astaci]|eukprot:XP_009833534.1 hypothetical protein H257_09115 [Aphanomyces astaci]